MIRRMMKLSLPFALALVAAGCPNNTATTPVINSFTATPASIHAGQKATLSWDVTGASTVSIDNGVGIQTGSSVDVFPTQTTTYTLIATGASGSVASATAQVQVAAAVAKPVITAFTASPNSVATGGSSTLSWTITGQLDSVTLDPGGIDVTAQTSGGAGSFTANNIAADTTFTLTATNSGGSATATAAVTTHSPLLHLQYTDPTSTTAKLLLVRNGGSTSSHLVLDLKVGSAPVTAFGVALNIPFDPASAGMVTFTNSTAAATGGLMEGSINIGSGPATAAAMLGGPAMQNIFSVGVAKHKSIATDGDDTWAAGSVLFSVAFDMGGSATAGTNVFLAASVASNPKYRAAALHKDGTVAVGQADVALGDFIISN